MSGCCGARRIVGRAGAATPADANQHLVLALATQQAGPIRQAYEALPDLPWACQWANFLRTHDELDLGRLGERERDRVFEVLAPEPGMRLYDRGIRRRLAPMLGNDRRRQELAYSLIFTLPGTPVLRYGDEIGMGDDLTLDDRQSVRTPMQWSGERNGGFSSAGEEHLIRPVIEHGEFGYARVNVDAQRRDPGSLLSWMRRALGVRRECPEVTSGRLEFIDAGDPAVLAHRCVHDHGVLTALHNLSGEPRHVRVPWPDGAGFTDLLTSDAPDVQDGALAVDLPPFGYRWFRSGPGHRG
jgi:maltose alpha-D-glucosyltransferase/alpha-amylase